MASTALVRRRPVVMFAPKRRGAVRRRASSGLRRKGHHHKGSASVSSTAHTTTLAAGGLILGALDGRGYLARIPVLGGSKALTLGVAGYLAIRYAKNKYIKATGVAALVSAAFDYGRVHFSGGTKASGFDTDGADGIDGPDGVEGEDFDDTFGSGFQGDGGPY